MQNKAFVSRLPTAEFRIPDALTALVRFSYRWFELNSAYDFITNTERQHFDLGFQKHTVQAAAPLDS